MHLQNFTYHYYCLYVHQGSNGTLLRLEVGEVLLNGADATLHQFSKSFHFPGEKRGVSMDGQKLAYNILITHKHSTHNPLMIIIKEGIPNDGTPIEDVVTVSLGLTVYYVILATAGMAFSVVCILFNLIFRQKPSVNLLGLIII